ncbi:DUF6520 family protein [Sinomicrobium soli]|uniref:DUF6520 family protein n=1 Tax=Sinomicrobium sp. N-1-3-6 TaxID=2219864 RepID=UPI000DCD6492|nr:DUF6520 family protein [Sinomicrobium sp. N-1-3-6]RAV27551.1 hypothetical protein DN748_17840 [Sinomicrobium sp. N-1-3-6]
MKKLKFVIAAMVIAVGVVGVFAFSVDEKEPVQQMYDLRETPTGPILETGTAAEINAYSNEHYDECTGNGENCTYVFEAGTSTRETSLERHEVE